MLHAYNEVWCRLKKPLVSKGVTARVQDRMARLGSSREWEERSTTACSYFLHCARAGQKKVFWFLPGVGERSTTAHPPFPHCARAGQKHALLFKPFFLGGFQPGVGERNTAACFHFSLYAYNKALRLSKKAALFQCGLSTQHNREVTRYKAPGRNQTAFSVLHARSYEK